MEQTEIGIIWDDAKFLVAVARTGSFNAAGRMLGVAHTTVSRRIRSLETMLGVDLIEREPGGVAVLTEIGTEVTSLCEAMLASVGKMVAVAGNAKRQLEGEVRLNVTEGLANYWLMSRMSPFLNRHPGIRLSWHLANTRWCELGREVDVAVRLHPPEEQFAVSTKIGSMGYSVFASKEYARMHGLPARVEELAKHPLLHVLGYDANPSLAAWSDIVTRRAPSVVIENSAASAHLLRSGNLVGLLPNYAALLEPNLERAPLDLGITIEAFVVYHEDRRNVPRIRAVVDEIKRLALEDSGSWFE